MRRPADVWFTARLADVLPETLPGPDRHVVSDPRELPEEPFALHGSGWTLLQPVEPGGRGDGLLRVAARGVDLVLEVEPSAVPALVEELRRIAVVHVDPDPEDLRGRLSSDHRSLLVLIAAGHSVAEAGRRLGLSRRTAYRRLDEVGELLGAVSTVDAVRRARRAGLIDEGATEGMR